MIADEETEEIQRLTTEEEKDFKNTRFDPQLTAANSSNLKVVVGAIWAVISAQQYGMAAVKNTLVISNQFLQRYPAIKNFVYGTVALSILPVGVFSIFLVCSLVMSVITAAVGVVVFQSAAVVLGLSVLLPVEIGVVCISAGAAMFWKPGNAEKLLKENVPEKYSSYILSEINEKDDMTLLIQ